MLNQLLTVCVVFNYWLTLVNGCNLVSSNCAAIPTTTADTGSTSPTILYLNAQNSDGSVSTGTIAFVTCTNIGTSAILATTASTAYGSAQMLTCTNGVWSNTNTFTCKTACPALTCCPTAWATYSNGYDSITQLSAPNAQVQVSCTGHSSLWDLFEGTGFLDGSGNTPTSLTSPQTYTCSNAGMWMRSGQTASHTDVCCYKKCAQTNLPINKPAAGYVAARENGMIATGATYTADMISNAAYPCGAGASYTPTIMNNMGDATHSASTPVTTGTFTLTCWDGLWNATVTDTTATPNSQTGILTNIMCT